MMANPGMKRERPLEDGGMHGPPKRTNTQSSESVMRLLIPSRKVENILGSKGAAVRQISAETNARISVMDGMPGSDERVAIITSREDPTQELSGAQSALQLVHMKILEGDEPNPITGGFVCRILCCNTQAGSVIGKQGKIVKEIRETTGCTVKVLPQDELPSCALANDSLVTFNGSPDGIQQALRVVTKQLRDHCPKEKPVPQAPAHHMLGGAAPVPDAAPTGSYQQQPQPQPQPQQQQQPVYQQGPQISQQRPLAQQAQYY